MFELSYDRISAEVWLNHLGRCHLLEPFWSWLSQRPSHLATRCLLRSFFLSKVTKHFGHLKPNGSRCRRTWFFIRPRTFYYLLQTLHTWILVLLRSFIPLYFIVVKPLSGIARLAILFLDLSLKAMYSFMMLSPKSLCGTSVRSGDRFYSGL